MADDYDDDERKQIRKDFRDAVNMSPSDLSEWLESEESRSVGDDDSGESTGHEYGRTIVELHKKNVGDYDDGDYDDMKKVVGYVHRHLAQRPDGDVTETAWRYSLMNWGHDPLED